MAVFCEYAFKFATYENLFMFFLCLPVCSFICLVGHICLSLVVIVYFISYKSIYVTQSKFFLSFFLSFSNILEYSTRHYNDSLFSFS